MDDVNHVTPILTYQIASGPICYAAVNERTVYLEGNPEAGSRLYGEMPGGGKASSVNLTDVFLEFAMAWTAPVDAPEAQRQMQIFGRRLGKALAAQRAWAKHANGVLDRAADALEDVFRSLDTPFARRRTEREVSYQLDSNPLQVVAGLTGMEREAELAQYALNAMCQSMVEALVPEMRIQLPSEPNLEQVIFLRNAA
jgi:hypothetical protein